MKLNVLCLETLFVATLHSSGLHFPNLDIVRGLEPPYGLPTTLYKCYFFSWFHHSLLLHFEQHKWSLKQLNKLNLLKISSKHYLQQIQGPCESLFSIFREFHVNRTDSLIQSQPLLYPLSAWPVKLGKGFQLNTYFHIL